MKRVDLEDYLLIAEALLGIDADRLQHAIDIPRAESALHAPYASFDGVDFYPSTAEQAAILASRLIRNHPLPDGNKRSALVAMKLHLRRSGVEWIAPVGGQDEIASVFERLAARDLPEDDFVAWVARHVTTGVARLGPPSLSAFVVPTGLENDEAPPTQEG